ncbi:MAG: hypothetical protein J2O46_07595 [Nocardioides sp.]|nr:hypothetical protein [Nocardioides sp.]
MAIDYTKRPAAAPAAGPTTGASEGKVVLTKSAPAVSLTKRGTGGGILRVNLNWNSRPTGLRKWVGGGAVDLDLGCFFEYTDGSKGAVQALGNAFRDHHTFPDQRPIVHLDGDDRSGTNAEGENLYLDLDRLSSVRRILVYTYIYEGAPNWAAVDGVVTLFPRTGPQVEVRLDDPDNRHATCAIASLTNVKGELEIRREVRYVGRQSDLSSTFGWGLKFEPGRK